MSETAKTEPKCADCGTPLNEGEAKVFTVCDACWNRHYGRPAPTGEERET